MWLTCPFLLTVCGELDMTALSEEILCFFCRLSAGTLEFLQMSHFGKENGSRALLYLVAYWLFSGQRAIWLASGCSFSTHLRAEQNGTIYPIWMGEAFEHCSGGNASHRTFPVWCPKTHWSWDDLCLLNECRGDLYFVKYKSSIVWSELHVHLDFGGIACWCSRIVWDLRSFHWTRGLWCLCIR